MIKVKNISKVYGKKRVVNSINFEVNKGEIYGLLGPNAAGKTTTIRMLATAITPSSGEATMANLDLFTQPNEIKLRIGYVAQYFGLYEELSVIENIRFYASLYGIDNEELFHELMKTYKIDHFVNKRSGDLSGGYLRRLALICALTHDPDILLLDEPTAGIDPVTRKVLWDLFYELAQNGKTLFVTTHYMEEAARCNNIAFLNSGNIVAQGSPDEIRHSLSENDVYLLKAKFGSNLVKELDRKEEIRLINQYGEELRFVVNKSLSKEQLHKLIEPYVDEEFELLESSPNLEDVFIALTQEEM